MARIRWRWVIAALTLTGGAAWGTSLYVSSKRAACQALLPRCEEAQRVATRLCAVHCPGACRARDDAYAVEFQDAESQYRQCGDSEAYGCWSTQRFRDEPGRRQAAEAAARLCAEGRAYACVML